MVQTKLNCQRAAHLLGDGGSSATCVGHPRMSDTNPNSNKAGVH